MNCKQLFYFSGILLLIWTVGAFAAFDLALWDNGGQGNLWSVPENWDTDIVPGADSAAVIDIADANCVIDDSVTAACAALTIGFTPFIGNCYFDMTGGSLTIRGRLMIGDEADCNGVFTMSGGTVSGGGRLWIGSENGNGTFIMRGGHMIIGDKLEIGKNEEAQGWMYMNGGTLEIGDDLQIADYGSGTVVMNGGRIEVVDSLKLGQGNGSANLYLNGGILQIGNDNVIMSGKSLLDISGGQLLIDDPTDATGGIEDHMANGFITAYGGLGTIEIAFDANEDLTTVRATRPDPEYAWAPYPLDNAKVEWAEQGITMIWRPGQYAAQHGVYFGTDSEAVAQADSSGSWSEYQGLQDANSFETGPLQLGQTYSWRVDEVNNEVEGSPWKGQVWSFRVADYLVVDDFERYTNDWEALERIYQTWIDGTGYTKPAPGKPGNGSAGGTGHTSGSPHETEIVTIGSTQSMPFYYTNDGTFSGNPNVYYSEVIRTFDDPQDWTREGVKALSLWFYGDPNNDANATEQLYVKINGQRIDYDGHRVDLTEERWHEWSIDLAAFGVDLTNVTTMAIGCGYPGNNPGGTGVIYVDDIRLYLPRCMPARLKAAGDLDQDCDVDYDDIAIMAGDWLEHDSLVVGMDGVLENFPADNSQWSGGTLHLDGVDDWVDINDSDMGHFHDKTIEIWVKINEYPEPYPYIFCFQNAGDDPYRIYIRTYGDDSVRARLVEDYVGVFVTGEDWHHLAFVLRDTDDGWCTGEFYGDGVLIDQLPGQPRHTGGAKGVNLGSFNDGSKDFLNVDYQDFRIYDAALSADEIKYLAGVSGGVEPTSGMLIHYNFDETSGLIAKNSSSYVYDHALISAAELYSAEAEGSRTVNFKDFAVLADTWLDTLLWPQ